MEWGKIAILLDVSDMLRVNFSNTISCLPTCRSDFMGMILYLKCVREGSEGLSVLGQRPGHFYKQLLVVIVSSDSVSHTVTGKTRWWKTAVEACSHGCD